MTRTRRVMRLTAEGTADRLARLLDVDEATVYRACSDGTEVRGFKVVRTGRTGEPGPVSSEQAMLLAAMTAVGALSEESRERLRELMSGVA